MSMQDTIESLVTQALSRAQEEGRLPEFELPEAGVERPANPDNGDWTSTVALRSAKLAHMAPRALAEAIVACLPADASIDHAEVAGPGFVNFYLKAASKNDVFATIRTQGMDFGRSDLGGGQHVQVEYVSANPVGPMHIGHGRWAALGDSLCNVLDHAGYEVEREYYINDHGTQMDVFGASVAERYLQLLSLMEERGVDLDGAAAALVADRAAYADDEDDANPAAHPLTDAFNQAMGENSYGGTYIIDIARRLVELDGDAWRDVPEAERVADFRERGYQMMLEVIRATCHDARCDFDRWFSERTLYERDAEGKTAVDRAIGRLDEMGHVFRGDDGALWFRSTSFGDDKDRVLVKSNGDYTYFASDVAYHHDKFSRVDHVIDIWGADHHGYVTRVEAVCAALGHEGGLEVLLGQLVNLLRDGTPVRMSKRKGVMVTFRELLDEVGVDATRYTLVSKSSNQTIDFDIEKAKRQDTSNPVYYVQYAHARICSILRRAADVGEDEARGLGMDEVARRAVGGEVDLALLTHESELALARKLSEFPGLVEGCARDRAPFRITHYCEELAATFHGFYTVCHVLPSAGYPVDAELSRARLAACDAVRICIALCLKLVGVSAPYVM